MRQVISRLKSPFILIFADMGSSDLPFCTTHTLPAICSSVVDLV